MYKQSFPFSSATTELYTGAGFSDLKKITNPAGAVLITDEHVYSAHARKFRGWNCIILKPGEAFKVQSTADAIIEQLISMEADRKTVLVGVGGGVVTDITGYVASVYMRGLRFGFIPTTVLGLVDASLGGKNGIDVGVYKNLVGLVRQPAFILHDMSLLKSLPVPEWQNGFAEIIKHACIRDAAMFRALSEKNLPYFRRSAADMAVLVRRNARLKARIVMTDEFEQGDRRLLNFGHTLGHALENQYELLHGQAVAIGMTYACHLSAQFCGFRQTGEVTRLLSRYGLPTYAAFDPAKVFAVLKMDKKRERTQMNYVLLERIGKAMVKPVDLAELERIIHTL